MESPETTPPKMMSMILSPRKGAKSKMLRNSEERATWAIEKMTKRLLMPLQHMSATGMFSASMPSEVSIWTPPSEVMRSRRTATPVKPLGRRSAAERRLDEEGLDQGGHRDGHRGDDAADDGEARELERAVGELVDGVRHGRSFCR